MRTVLGRVTIWGLLLAATGCGNYGERLNATHEDLKAGRRQAGQSAGPARGMVGSVDPALYPSPLEVVGSNNAPTGIRVHVPAYYYDAAGAAQFAYVPAGDARAMPPGITAAEWLNTYEIFVKDGTGKELPQYIYFCQFPAGTTAQQAKDKLAQAWASTGEHKASLGSNEWIGVSTQGNYMYTPRGGTAQSLPGQLSCYIYQSPTRTVVLIFNAPQSVEQTNKFISETAGKVAIHTQAS